jgi:hypothetical protein
MGKILTYLNISEENQTRDLLDAERLLEGMQAIYAASSSGSKKDNLAVPLAEMTKIFIEKAKVIAPKEEVKEEPTKLPFNVGDKFKSNVSSDYESEYGIFIFTILSIDEKTSKVEIEGFYVKDNKKRNFTLDVNKVVERINDKDWIPYENEDTFSVGDMFYSKDDGEDYIYQVFKIDGQVFTYVTGNEGDIEFFEDAYTTNEANKNLKDGAWVKVAKEKDKPKEQDFPYQVDDRFYLPSLKANFKISKISGDNVSIRYEGGEMFTLTKSSFLKNIKIKTYIPLSDTEFKIGDKYLNKTVKDTFTIIQVYTDFIDVKFTGGNEATYDILFGKEKIADGTWVKVLDEEKEEPKEDEYEFKFVGDEFYNTERDEIFVVSEVYKKSIVIEYEDGEREVFSKDTAKALIKDKYWVKVVDEEKEEPKNYKVGDKFLWAKENMTFTIDFIKNGELGIIYSDGLTGIMTIEQFEKGLSTGYYQPYTEQPQEETDLYFKIGDKFLGKYNNRIYLIENIDKNNNIVEYSILNKDGEKISANDGSISTIQDYIKRSDWIKYEEKDNTQPKRKKREPRVKSEQDKKIEHILDINIDEIQF